MDVDVTGIMVEMGPPGRPTPDEAGGIEGGLPEDHLSSHRIDKRIQRELYDELSAPYSVLPSKQTPSNAGSDILFAVARAMDTRVVWMIVLPATAECLIAEVLPTARTEAGLDVASSLANIIGAYLEGLLYAVERESTNAGTQQLCSMVRLWCLNVFTSFPFVPVHAAEMAVLNGLHDGVLYVAVSLTLSVLSFELGRRPVESVLRRVKAGRVAEHWTNRLGVDRVRHRILFVLIAFIFLTLTKTNWYLGRSLMLEEDFSAIVTQGVTTLVGIVFAVTGVVTGSYIGSTGRCNFVSCLLVLLAFVTVRETYGSLESDSSMIVFTKFVGSFCGAISGFAAMLSDMGRRLYHDLQPREALKGILGNAAIAVFWAFVFYVLDERGWEIYSHPLGAA